MYIQLHLTEDWKKQALTGKNHLMVDAESSLRFQIPIRFRITTEKPRIDVAIHCHSEINK